MTTDGILAQLHFMRLKASCTNLHIRSECALRHLFSRAMITLFVQLRFAVSC